MRAEHTGTTVCSVGSLAGDPRQQAVCTGEELLQIKLGYSVCMCSSGEAPSRISFIRRKRHGTQLQGGPCRGAMQRRNRLQHCGEKRASHVRRAWCRPQGCSRRVLATQLCERRTAGILREQTLHNRGPSSGNQGTVMWQMRGRTMMVAIDDIADNQATKVATAMRPRTAHVVQLVPIPV